MESQRVGHDSVTNTTTTGPLYQGACHRTIMCYRIHFGKQPPKTQLRYFLGFLEPQDPGFPEGDDIQRRVTVRVTKILSEFRKGTEKEEERVEDKYPPQSDPGSEPVPAQVPLNIVGP